jgi:hemolysin III
MAEVLDRRAELANTLTHGAGAVASAVGAAILITLTALRGDAWGVIGRAVFGATLVLLYTASTLYHATVREGLKARLKVLDHSAIYLLIAGSYTPFTLGPLRGGWGWSLFAAAWSLAVAGVIFKLYFTGRFNRLSTAIYIAMGWMVIVAIGPMVQRLPVAVLAWLVAGGIAYTAGTAFYHGSRRYSHAVWHLFVLAGSACHFTAVTLQMLTPR